MKTPLIPLNFQKGSPTSGSIEMKLQMTAKSDAKPAKEVIKTVTKTVTIEVPVIVTVHDPEVMLPAGKNIRAEAAVIPLELMRDRRSLRTDNKFFSAEDDDPPINPIDVPRGYVDATPARKSAWWKIEIPVDDNDWYLDADTELSFWGDGAQPCTTISVYVQSEGSLERMAGSRDATDENQIYLANQHTHYFGLARVTNVRLIGDWIGTPVATYYIHVDQAYFGAPDFDQSTLGPCAYVLTVTLRRESLGNIPEGEPDPADAEGEEGGDMFLHTFSGSGSLASSSPTTGTWERLAGAELSEIVIEGGYAYAPTVAGDFKNVLIRPIVSVPLIDYTMEIVLKITEDAETAFDLSDNSGHWQVLIDTPAGSPFGAPYAGIAGGASGSIGYPALDTDVTLKVVRTAGSPGHVAVYVDGVLIAEGDATGSGAEDSPVINIPATSGGLTGYVRIKSVHIYPTP